jgi:hypothetical protein
MFKILYKYKGTIIFGMMFVQSLIIDYSKNKDNFHWIGVFLYEIYSILGLLSINILFLFLAVTSYIAERKSRTGVKINFFGVKVFLFIMLILVIIYDTIIKL